MAIFTNVAEFDIESQIRDYDDWRAPYIGRTIKGNFWEEFKLEKVLDKDGKDEIVGVHILESNTERPNMFDEETTTHGLEVCLSVAKEITQTLESVLSRYGEREEPGGRETSPLLRQGAVASR